MFFIFSVLHSCLLPSVCYFSVPFSVAVCMSYIFVAICVYVTGENEDWKERTKPQSKICCGILIVCSFINLGV